MEAALKIKRDAEEMNEHLKVCAQQALPPYFSLDGRDASHDPLVVLRSCTYICLLQNHRSSVPTRCLHVSRIQSIWQCVLAPPGPHGLEREAEEARPRAQGRLRKQGAQPLELLYAHSQHASRVSAAFPRMHHSGASPMVGAIPMVGAMPRVLKLSRCDWTPQIMHMRAVSWTIL